MKAFRIKKPAGFTLVEIMIVVLIIGILLAIAIPNFIQARESSRAKACIANLKQIDSAKQQYLMDKSLSTFATVTQATAASTDTALGSTGTPMLVPTYVRATPVCPAGGLYTSGDASTLPSCNLGNNTVNGTNYPHVLK